MALAVILGLFFGGFAAGSLHTARQDYRWRNATEVHGVLVKQGSRYHYEYRGAGKAAILGPELGDQWSNDPDGVVDDWVPLDYDSQLPEHLRRHLTKGRAATNYKHSMITAAAGVTFLLAFLACVWAFFRALYDKRHPGTF